MSERRSARNTCASVLMFSRSCYYYRVNNNNNRGGYGNTRNWSLNAHCSYCLTIKTMPTTSTHAQPHIHTHSITISYKLVIFVNDGRPTHTRTCIYEINNNMVMRCERQRRLYIRTMTMMIMSFPYTPRIRLTCCAATPDDTRKRYSSQLQMRDPEAVAESMNQIENVRKNSAQWLDGTEWQ